MSLFQLPGLYRGCALCIPKVKFARNSRRNVEFHAHKGMEIIEYAMSYKIFLQKLNLLSCTKAKQLINVTMITVSNGLYSGFLVLPKKILSSTFGRLSLQP